jgi:hypothetical protein
MSQIEDLLRQALTEMPVTPTVADPLTRIDVRVRRARRRLALGAGVAAAAVVAAVVVPLATIGTGRSQGVQVAKTPSPSTGSTATVWLNAGAHGVTSGDLLGRSWVIVDAAHGRRQLLQLSPTGRPAPRFGVPQASDFAEGRNGIVWVWGGGDGGYPTPVVTWVDTIKGRSHSIQLPGLEVVGLVIAEDGSAYVGTSTGIEHLTVTSHGLVDRNLEATPHASAIAGTATARLWLQAGRTLWAFDPAGSAPMQPAGHTTWNGKLLGTAYDGRRLWVQTSPHSIGILDPTAHASGVGGSVGPELELSGPATQVIADPGGGLFVLLQHGGVDYFSAQAITAAGPPTASLPRSYDVETMAVTLDGGVDLSTFSGRLLHWRPIVG